MYCSFPLHVVLVVSIFTFSYLFSCLALHYTHLHKLLAAIRYLSCHMRRANSCSSGLPICVKCKKKKKKKKKKGSCSYLLGLSMAFMYNLGDTSTLALCVQVYIYIYTCHLKLYILAIDLPTVLFVYIHCQ